MYGESLMVNQEVNVKLINNKPSLDVMQALSPKGRLLLEAIQKVFNEKSQANDSITALEVVLGISRDLGGLQFYLPSERNLIATIMHKKVCDEYSQGTKATTLATKYEVSIQHIYRIIEKNKLKEDSSCH